MPGIDKMLYHEIPKQVNQNFAFTIKKRIKNDTYLVLTRNKIQLSDNYQVLSSINNKIVDIKLKKILDDNNEVNYVSAPMSEVTIVFNKNINLKENDIVRIIS
jgi:hypothetical protein